LSQIGLSDGDDEDLDLVEVDEGEGDLDRRTLACLRRGGRHRPHLLQLQEDGVGYESESDRSIDLSEQVDDVDGG